MNPYDILGVKRDATLDEIRTAKRKLAAIHHPDREGGSSEAMAVVNEAFAILSDAERRAHYDSTGDTRAIKTLDGEAYTMAIHFLQQVIKETDELDVVNGALVLLDHLEQSSIMGKQQAQTRLALHVRRANSARLKAQSKSKLDFVTNTLDHFKAEASAHIAAMEGQLRVCARAKELLSEYEQEGDSGELARRLAASSVWTPRTSKW